MNSSNPGTYKRNRNVIYSPTPSMLDSTHIFSPLGSQASKKMDFDMSITTPISPQK